MSRELKTEIDYLESKMTNLDVYTGATGASAQDRFDNLSSDSARHTTIAYNNVTADIAVPFLATQYLIGATAATSMYMGIILKSIEDNASACQDRFDNKAKGWFPILFAYFEVSVAQSIIDAIRDYMSDYVKYAKFGTQYGDSELGLLDFIEGTGGIITDLEDFQLLSGSDYTAVKAALKTYFLR